MPQLIMGRLPELFPQPERFMPERWSKENTNTPHPFSQLPFGFGPRMCPGNWRLCSCTQYTEIKYWLGANSIVCREVLFAWGRLIVFMHYWYILTYTITAGRRIAELATYINLALIIKKFRLKFPEDTPMDYFMMIALSPKRRMNLVFEDLWKSATEFLCDTKLTFDCYLSVLDETQ